MRLAHATFKTFEVVSTSGGRTMLLFAPPTLKKRVNAWCPPRPDLALARRLKSSFDSCNIFTPGRLLLEKEFGVREPNQ